MTYSKRIKRLTSQALSIKQEPNLRRLAQIHMPQNQSLALIERQAFSVRFIWM